MIFLLLCSLLIASNPVYFWYLFDKHSIHSRNCKLQSYLLSLSYFSIFLLYHLLKYSLFHSQESNFPGSAIYWSFISSSMLTKHLSSPSLILIISPPQWPLISISETDTLETYSYILIWESQQKHYQTWQQ